MTEKTNIVDFNLNQRFEKFAPKYKMTSIGGNYATEKDVKEIMEILSSMRVSRGQAERDFIKKYIKPVAEYCDEYGNYYLQIGSAPILWSSHTDTVHYENGRQKVQYKEGMITLTKSAKERSDCLGADCGAGIWLMLEMIKAGVEGLYIFHRDEESGRKGSEWIVAKKPEVLEGMQYAIAFDRYGTSSIITHQRGSRCCSEAFSKSLADALDMGHESDALGSYTDTASYTHIIPECTNLSVGYYDQHSELESQDVQYLCWLRDQLINADFTSLVCERDPAEKETTMSYIGHYHGFSAIESNDKTSYDKTYYNKTYYDKTYYDKTYYDKTSYNKTYYNKTYYDKTYYEQNQMEQYVYDNPNIIAMMLIDMGYTSDEMADLIQDKGGTIVYAPY